MADRYDTVITATGSKRGGEGMETVGIKPDTHEPGMVIWRHIKEITEVGVHNCIPRVYAHLGRCITAYPNGTSVWRSLEIPRFSSGGIHGFRGLDSRLCQTLGWLGNPPGLQPWKAPAAEVQPSNLPGLITQVPKSIRPKRTGSKF